MERLNAKVINALICLNIEKGPVHMLGELLEKHSFDAVHLENRSLQSSQNTTFYWSFKCKIVTFSTLAKTLTPEPLCLIPETRAECAIQSHSYITCDSLGQIWYTANTVLICKLFICS